MRKIKKADLFVKIFCFIFLAAILIAMPLTAGIMNSNRSKPAEGQNDLTVLNIWQIDSFEGGKGSRADYLNSVGAKFTKTHGCYVKVTSLSPASARENLGSGTVPELISYGAGMCGIENYICGKTPFITWCYGGYCILTVDESADFSDITADNTVINGGTENFSSAAALFCNLSGSDVEKPTGAYVKLINGKYKYLLGTQRDIFRLKTRGVAFKVKPMTEFNDLYQNISVTTKNTKLKTYAEKYIEFLLSESQNLTKIGMMADGLNLYNDEMYVMEQQSYEFKLVSPVSEQAKNELTSAISNKDLKMLKNLLK